CEFVDNENLKGGAAIEVAEVVAVPTLGFSEFIELNVQNCLFAQHDSGQTVILTEKTTENILTNNTFADNEMPALNVKNSGILQLRNNIIQSPNHPDIEFETNGTITSLGGNLISDSSASQYLQVSDMEGADPEFKGEGEHPYQIHFTSPAVDLGVFYQGFDPNRPDLAGNPRFQGIVVDAGAYESPFTTTIKDFREENDALNMYPVPLKTIATLTLTNNWKGEMTLKVFDTKGQQVLLEKLTKNLYQAEWEVDFGQLPRGNYHLLLSDGNHAITKAFVKM
ncbi:MAG: T9SS type A sorting domain-containing protein, partial [Bacteroidetes bacterium]|nr:T9SS type A sorting domain-containing protein [Bacteroidota bacterium]